MTIKSHQFIKLYWNDDENVEEWMGRLHVAAVQCSYQEVNRQQRAVHTWLKQQIYIGRNNKGANSHQKQWPHNKWK